MLRLMRGKAAPNLNAVSVVFVVLLTGCTSVERAYDRIAAGGSDPPAANPPAQTSAANLRAGLSPADVVSADRTVQEALESALSNQNRRWVGARNGTYGFVTPLRTFRITTGHYCRDFLETVARGASVLSVTKTACRDDDGQWKEIRRPS